jgi:hypothetical protein
MATFLWWKNNNVKLLTDRKNQSAALTETKTPSRFVIVDSIHDAPKIEKSRAMPHSEMPQQLPNADAHSPIIVAKLPK